VATMRSLYLRPDRAWAHWAGPVPVSVTPLLAELIDYMGSGSLGTAQRERADVAVLDPPRSGAGREVIDLLAAAEVPRVIHIGCEAASFARDVGLYLGHGYVVEDLRVFDSFPLTHHVECVAVLTR